MYCKVLKYFQGNQSTNKYIVNPVELNDIVGYDYIGTSPITMRDIQNSDSGDQFFTILCHCSAELTCLYIPQC